MRWKRPTYLSLPRGPSRRRRSRQISPADPRPRSWREAWERDPWGTPGGWITILAEAVHTAGVFARAFEIAVRRFLRELRARDR